MTIARATAAASSAALSQVRVARYAEVVSYDTATQTATIREIVREPRLNADGEIVAPEPVQVGGVPVQWPNAGGRSITWGLDQGDTGLALVRDISHDEVDAGAATPTIPASLRRFNWSDAVFLPGATIPGDPLPSSAVRSDGQPVWALPSGEAVHIGDSMAAKTLALAQETAARVERIEAYLNTATYSTPAGPTVAPSPPPFTGTTSTVPVCTASVVVGSVAATTTAALQSGRIKVDT